MTQEDKSQLLKDLCARLPYGVFLKIGEYSDYTLQGIVPSNTNKPLIVGCNGSDFECSIEVVKLYLRPLSSMTEEEAEEFRLDFHYNFYIGREYSLNNNDGNYMMPMFVMRDYFNWLNKHHFDYRGLIEKGLALEAPNGMYNIKEK